MNGVRNTAALLTSKAPALGGSWAGSKPSPADGHQRDGRHCPCWKGLSNRHALSRAINFLTIRHKTVILDVEKALGANLQINYGSKEFRFKQGIRLLDGDSLHRRQAARRNVT